MTPIRPHPPASVTLAAIVFVLLASGCTPSPCSLPAGLELPLGHEQIHLPGLDAQLRRCVASVYDRVPYEPTGHEAWDRFMAGDNSALSNEAKVGALLYFGEDVPFTDGPVEDGPRREVLPGLDFEEEYRKYLTRRGRGHQEPAVMSMADRPAPAGDAEFGGPPAHAGWNRAR